MKDFQETKIRWLDIAVISVMVALFATAVGGTPVLMGVVLRERDYSAAFVGASAGMTPLGIIAGAFAMPAFNRRVSAFLLACACAVAGVAILCAMAAVDNAYAWLVARLLWGVCIAGFYIVTKAWIADLTPAAHRGRIIGVFTTLLAAGFSSGPMLLSLVAFSTRWGLLLLASAIFAALVLLVCWRRRLPQFKGKQRVSVLSFVPMAPVLVVCAALFGLFDHSTLAFLPAYSLDKGMSAAEVGIAIAALNIGNVFFQVPIGWLADRFRRDWVLGACAGLTSGGALLLPIATGSMWFYPFLMLWGALAYGVATIAVALLGDHFSDASLLAGSAALTMAGGLGGVFGPPVIGFGIDVVGPVFLPGAIAFTFLALAAVAAMFGGVRAKAAVL